MARNAALNVSLTPRLRNYIRAKVKSGGYESASEVVRDSLRALQERDRAAEAFWADVRAKVSSAEKQIEDGLGIDGDSAMDEIIAESASPLPAPKKKRKTSR